MDNNLENPCRCCLSRVSAKDLRSNNIWIGKTEVYEDMLKECFQINIICDQEGEDRGICEVCVTRLRDAFDFKKQVDHCQKLFLRKKLAGKSVKVEHVVKVEISDDDDRQSDDYDNYIPEVKKDTKVATKRELRVDVELLPRPAKAASLAKVRKIERASERRVQSAVDREIVKKITQRYVQKVLAERKRQAETSVSRLVIKKTASLSQVVASSARKKITAGPSIPTERSASWSENENNFISRKKQKSNLNHIMRFSTCTPFRTKTLAGYGCAFCKESFHDPKVLRTHTHEKHNEEKPNFKSRLDINNLAVKVDIMDLACRICNEQIPDIKTLKTHLVAEHEKRIYMDVKDFTMEFKLAMEETHDCALCSSTFETFKMLLQHMNNHYRNYICDTCGVSFLNVTRLRNHKTTHIQGSFRCEICDKVFPTQAKRSYHEKFTHSKVRYTTNCPMCEESFQSYYKRNQHLIQVHNTAAASYKCNICDRTFLLKAQLTNHTKKVHLMERNHVCTECGQGFYQKQYLREHMIKHNGERIHKCDVCQKSYARKKTLREHMRIHNNDRRHKCEVCGLGFVQKCSLKSHLLSNHCINAS